VVCGKPPASTTECTQACKCVNCFKRTKTALKGIKDRDINVDLNAHLLTFLKDKVFAVHMAKTKAPTNTPDPPVASSSSSNTSQKKATKAKPTQISAAHHGPAAHTEGGAGSGQAVHCPRILAEDLDI
jgi:hypothetical protein